MYNKKEIMKNAWNIRRLKNLSMSSALKESWAMAKQPRKPIFDGYAEVNGFEFSLWQKHGLNRIYVNNRTGHNKSNKGGYIDLDHSNSIVATGSVKYAAQSFLREYAIRIEVPEFAF